ncbi:HpcH/HpaI aldolase/citrate lyase family protein [Haloarcula onubensis]|uniref:CoA ester lyase n=1 Tax=Haloarcula onubensis TaxID=2950539 RepID=A0ABU2FPR5_9EURY|nr:CoA ester lyase [Halomicroarcula sp. S3CR25-11]MDS0282748.1 CoA ester lyase [Halomicroarcula sp. S3CR25-11]
MSNQLPLRRSLLGIPGNERPLVGGAVDSEADEIFFDLEDSLGPGEKVAARSTLVDIVADHDWTERGLSYRINGTETRWWYDDVVEVVSGVGAAIDTLIVPKVRAPADVQAVEKLLTSVERNAGLDAGSVGLSAQIETASGMNAVTDIAHASDRLTALIFGPADYAASVGAAHGATDYPGHYWHYPLSRLSHAAASADLLAIGGPYTGDDPEGFGQACRYERALGYDGKVVIHPDQVATANDAFAPDIAEARRAKEIVETYEAAGADTPAAIDGNVIDREMYRMAARILSKAEQADLL